MSAAIDPFGRAIRYLRVSLTDRCNLRCVYCMPEEGVPHQDRERLLTYEEITRIVRVAAELGVIRIRLTGGEPTVRQDLTTLVRWVSEVPGITDLSLTTNAVLLDRLAQPLADAGLRRINVSIDSLMPDRFFKITRFGRLSDVLRGLDAARDAGLSPIKLNVVVMRGVNDDEIADFARLTLENPWVVRFIELMPIGPKVEAAWNRAALLEETGGARGCAMGDTGFLHGGLFISLADIRRRVESVAPLTPSEDVDGGGPAHYWTLPGALGRVGFISQVSHDMCPRCNRLRLTPDGKLRPCLLNEGETDLLRPLRGGATDADLRDLFLHSIKNKPERHRLEENFIPRDRFMSQIGG